ncbi:hypothetical protein [Lewinella cohaerens]|uniref:hypothetical protein n=1 Tax=Lewinella cohaerens TaxID=70995 RepID=UPI00036CF9B5|nr:hypothetical protein [Lewinella cohaerens]
MKQIQFKWFNWLHLFVAAILGICILAGSIYVVTLIDEGPFLLKLFPLPFFIGGLFLLYFCLAIYLNTTIIRLGNMRIVVETSPLYWHRPISLPVADIEKLKLLRTHRQGGSNSTFTYKISAKMSDGSEETLVPSSIPIEHNNGLEVKESIEMMLLKASLRSFQR